MRHRVTIQRQSTSVDSVGQPLDSWTAVRTVWAEVRPLGTRNRIRERFLESGEVSELTHEVYMRHLTDITSKDRLLYDGRVMDIEAIVDPDERHHLLTLVVKEHEHP